MYCYTKVGKNACIVDVCLCLVPGTNSIMAQFDNINPYHWPGWFIVALALFYIGIALIVFREIRPPPKLKRPKGSVSCHCLTRIKLSTQLQSDWKMQFTVSSIYTCMFTGSLLKCEGHFNLRWVTSVESFQRFL